MCATPRCKAERPFIVTIDPHKGIIDLCLTLSGEACKGVINGVIRPANFDGDTFSFTTEFEAAGPQTALHYRMSIPDPQTWWPNGYGKQSLYNLYLEVLPKGDLPQVFEEQFGLRTIEMHPLPIGKHEERYNWTFVVNSKPIFVKGANWCTIDALLRFTDERYDRFLKLARDQHINLLRAWGGGMPESDYFYNTCDRLGIMVIQEWPTCWDSHKQQPMNELIETATLGTIRLRNHPSLIQWAGGNEAPTSDGETMDAFARIAFELDGTRPFHRTSPWGGSIHNYSTYWGMEDMDVSLQLSSPFMGEFGMASAPNIRSVRRYLPKDEWNEWDLSAKNSFTYHTPRFNEFSWVENYKDIDHLNRCVPEFIEGDTMEKWILGTQLAQATAIRHTLESYRCRWPDATGICYYKLTDVYPACSWSTVDYYGVPKLSYYFIQDSYSPLHAVVQIRSTFAAEEYTLYLLDDMLQAAKSGCRVNFYVYGGDLEMLKSEEFFVTPFETVTKLGTLRLVEHKDRTPLFIVSEVVLDGKTVDRTFYWQNHRNRTGCMFECPKTTLVFDVIDGGHICISNTGEVPAVCVTVECPECDTTFTTEDSAFWLNAGERRVLAVNNTKDLTIRAWNADPAQTR